jgi:hypothetical protein
MTEAEVAAEQARVAKDSSERDAGMDARATATAREKAKDIAVAQAGANLGPVADAVEATGQPGIADVTRDQKDAIAKAVGELPPPVVTKTGLLKDAELERIKAQLKAGELQSKVTAASALAEQAEARRILAEEDAAAARRAEQEQRARADSEATTSFWLKAGGTTLGILTLLAGLASRLNLPGGQVVSSVLSIASPLLTRKAEVAEATAKAGDVGRTALGVLDATVEAVPELKDKLAKEIAKLTGGKVTSTEGLFKLAAKSYTVDDGAHVDSVDKFLNEIRGAIPTEGGIPVVLKQLLEKRSS